MVGDPGAVEPNLPSISAVDYSGGLNSGGVTGRPAGGVSQNGNGFRWHHELALK
jgi:hypothetical protein